MSQHVSAPNARVQRVYEELGGLLEQGDDVFVEQGPEIVKSAMSDPGFFDGVDTDHAGPDEYTRAKVIGEPGGHVIRFMEWPPEYTLCPHEHHGRPCFEVLVDGLLSVVNMEPQHVDDERYRMEVVGTELTRPGESAVIDPRENDVHAVYSPVRSRSLHVYPEDKTFAYGFELVDDDSEADYYTRERFELGGTE